MHCNAPKTGICSAGGSTPTPGPTRPPPTSKLIPVKPTETKVMIAPCWATFLKKWSDKEIIKNLNLLIC